MLHFCTDKDVHMVSLEIEIAVVKKGTVARALHWRMNDGITLLTYLDFSTHTSII
jgi:hypothetical protein